MHRESCPAAPTPSRSSRARRRAAFAVALALVSLAATAPSSSPHGLNRHDFLITHGRWWDGTKFVPRDRVYTVAGELRATWSGAVEDTIDLGDRCVLPPFSDAHTHLLSDTAMFAPNLRALLGAGVLYAQNPNNPGSRVAAVRERLARPGTLEMTFANGGLTAPGGHPAQIYDPAGAGGERPRSGDAYWEIADAADLAAKWSRVLAAKPDLIKAYLEHSEVHAERVAAKAYNRYGLDPRLLPEVVSRAHAAKLRVAVHVNSAEDFHVAVESGADEIAHLPLAPITPADAAQAAKRGVTVVTTLVSHRPTEGIAGLDRIERDNVRLLRRAGVKLALGTDHPVKTVAEEAAELVRIGAVTNQEVIRLLTHDTFEAIFPSRKPAQLRIGDEASFVVLEADPVAEIANLKKVAWCMKQGYHVELPALPSTKPGIADSLAPLLMRGDLEGALALDQRLRSEPHQELDCGEQQLNGLGYKLLQHGAKTPAVAIFRRNAEVFPRSANVYDSLADAYLATSDTTAAVGAYRKVLEVLPENPKYAPEYRAGLEARAKDFIAKHERRE